MQRQKVNSTSFQRCCVFLFGLSRIFGQRIEFSFPYIFRSRASSLCFPFRFIYVRITWLHLSFGHPSFGHVLITTSSSVFLSTCPNYIILASSNCITYVCHTSALPLISSVLIFSILVIPIISTLSSLYFLAGLANRFSIKLYYMRAGHVVTACCVTHLNIIISVLSSRSCSAFLS